MYFKATYWVLGFVSEQSGFAKRIITEQKVISTYQSAWEGKGRKRKETEGNGLLPCLNLKFATSQNVQLQA